LSGVQIDVIEVLVNAILVVRPIWDLNVFLKQITHMGISIMLKS